MLHDLKNYDDQFQHILHLYHHHISTIHHVSIDIDTTIQEDMPSAMELEKRGIVFKLKRENSDEFLECLNITFYRGTMEIPRININLDQKDMLQNLVDFEWSTNTIDGEKVTTLYLNFLMNLMKTPRDAQILNRAGVLRIENGSEEDIAKFFFDIMGPYKSLRTPHPLHQHIMEFQSKKRNFWMGALTQSYRDNPWFYLSATAATIIIILTFLQTIFSGLSL